MHTVCTYIHTYIHTSHASPYLPPTSTGMSVTVRQSPTRGALTLGAPEISPHIPSLMLLLLLAPPCSPPYRPSRLLSYIQYMALLF